MFSILSGTIGSSISRIFGEKLFHCQRTGKHSLLFSESYHVLDIVIVLLEPLIERMFAEEFSFFLQVRSSPGETQAMGLLHEFVIGAPRRRKGLEQAGCNPRIVLEDIRLDDDRMHDREDLGLLIVVALVLLEVGKQSLNGAFTPNPCFGQVRLRLRIDLPL